MGLGYLARLNNCALFLLAYTPYFEMNFLGKEKHWVRTYKGGFGDEGMNHECGYYVGRIESQNKVFCLYIRLPNVPGFEMRCSQGWTSF